MSQAPNMTRQFCKSRTLIAGQPLAAHATPAQNYIQTDWHSELVRLRASVEDLRRRISALREVLCLVQHAGHRESTGRITTELEAIRPERSRLADNRESELLQRLETEAKAVRQIELSRSVEKGRSH